MPTPFIMPKMDMDQESVYINEWLKKEGDTIEKGEPVIVIETDKITSEVEAPASGRLAGILYGENTEAPVTKIVAYILDEGETAEDLPDLGEAEISPKTLESESEDMSATSEKSEKQATTLAARMAKAENLNLRYVPHLFREIRRRIVSGRGWPG